MSLLKVKTRFGKTILSIIILFSSGLGQTTINFDTGGNWIQDGATALTSYGNHGYSESGLSIQGTNILRNGTSTQDGYPGALNTYSLRIRNASGAKIIATVASGGVSTFSFEVRRWDGSPIPDYTVKYSTDGGSNWTSLTNINGTLLTTSDWFTYNGTINAGDNNIKIEVANTGTTERIMIDDFIWSGYSSSSPTISVTSTTLDGFQYVVGSGPSSEQSFSASGTDLTANIIITPPTNFEVSIATGGSFVATNPITLTHSGGTVGSTTIYVRLKASLSVGNYSSENIALTSTDATSKYVSCTGEVLKLEPSNHVSGISVIKNSGTPQSAIDVSWSDNDGVVIADGYLIKASTSDNITDPVDGTAVADNATIGSNSGARNVAHGAEAYTWTGLSAEQIYYFKVYPYTNSSDAIDYKTTATVPSGNATTDAEPVAPQANKVIFNEIDMTGSPGYEQEAFELLVVNGPIDMRGWIITENTESDEITFASNSLWSNVETGTYITIYVRSGSGITEDTDASDKSISVKPDGGGYISGTAALATTELFYLSSGALSVENAVDAVNAGATVSNSYGLTIPDVGSGFAGYFSDGSSFDNDNSGNWIAYGSRTFGSSNTDQNDSSLPVELSSWKAISTKGLVKLLWTTDSEIENQGFIIERSLRTSSFDGAQDDKSPWKEIASFATNDDLLGQGSTSAQNEYFYIDKQVKVGKTYSYRLSDVDYRGNITRHAEIKVTVKDAGADLKPSDVKLHNAFPNPFNPDVNLSFTLENEVAELSLEIYDIQGALVQTLSSGYHEIGNHDFKWNGFDTNDHAVSSGVYMVRLSAGSVVQIQRVTLLR